MNKCLTFILFYFVTLLSYASPLPANEVFQVNAVQIDPKTFFIYWELKPGYFLYKDRIKVLKQEISSIQLSPIFFPKSQIKKDKQSNTYSIYRKQLSLPIVVSSKKPGKATIDLHFQGCADEGFCYPPETRQIKLTIDKNLALAGVNISYSDPTRNETNAETPLPNSSNSGTHETSSSNIPSASSLASPQQAATSEASSFSQRVSNLFSSSHSAEQILAGSHWIIAIAIFFGLGLLLSFTPCVLPMVPVLSGIIVGQGENLSTRRAFLLSLSYVLGMSVTYAIVGAVLASLGSNLQILMQSTWAIAIFSLIFVLLALSLFGYYDLEIPSSWRTKLSAMNPKGGHYLGAIFMGCLSTLILSPCVTAPLIGVLGYIAHHGSILFGSIALFFLGIGMGTPLILIGVSAGKWLPKAGPWMNAVKSFFGMVLLAVAVYLLGRILPLSAVAVLWAALFIFAGVYWSPFKGMLPRSFSNILQQAISLVLVSLGLITLASPFISQSSPFKFASTTTTANIQVHEIKTPEEFSQAILKAKGKPVMVDFYAEWCTSCKVMEATTLKDARIIQKLQNFVLLKVDLTSNKDIQPVLQQFNIIAPPTFLFFNKEGKELPNLRLVGEVSADQFLKQLTTVDN